MAIHPRALGARCDECLLRSILEETGEWSPDAIVAGTSPVPSELKSSAWFAIVDEKPGKDEVRLSRPMVGPSGMRLTQDLESIGVGRGAFDVLNALGCRPPNDDIDAVLKRAKKAKLPSPIDCCRPRLNAELARHDRILSLGNHSTWALLKTQGGILTTRGGPAEVDRTFLESVDGIVGTASASLDPVLAEGLIKILPTVHPAFVLRANRWAPIFMSDIGRAIRFFLGRLNWPDLSIYVKPTADALYEWLNRSEQFWAIDTETEYADALTADLRMVQIGVRDTAVVVPFYSIEDGHRFYDAFEEARIKEVLRWFVASTDHVKTGSNANYFDVMVLERHLGVLMRPVLDSLILHRLVAPELRHGLDIVASIYCDAPRWKRMADGTALSKGARTDAELAEYGGTDACASYAILPPILEEAAKRVNEVTTAFGLPSGQGLATPCPGMPNWTLTKIDHETQAMCRGLHKVGMFVDQAERQRLIQKYEERSAQLFSEIRMRAKEVGEKHFDPDVLDSGSFAEPAGGLVGVAPWNGANDTATDEDAARDAARERGELNPGSADQLRELLYTKFNLTPVKLTATGDPSTAGEVLLAHIIDPMTPPPLVKLLEAIRLYRRFKNKYLGTYLYPFGVMDKDGGGTREERYRTPKKQIEKMRLIPAHCWADGRVRCVWNAHVTNVGRLSASDPNLQTLPQVLRSMFGPAPGNVFIDGDFDQAHLRIIAARWLIKRLLRCFETGDDPHLLLGVDLFGSLLTGAQGWVDVRTKPKKKTNALKIRDNCKTLRYAGAYWAMVPTILSALLEAEDQDGNLINKHLTLREVTAMVQTWMRAEPEWEAAWETELAYFMKFGFVAEPILGRRNDFADIVRSDFRAAEDKERSAIVNFPILAMESSLARIAEHRFFESLPYSKKTDRNGWGSERFGPGTGLINQCHDSLLVEVPAEHGEWALGLVREAMNIRVPGYEVPFTSDPKITTRWDAPV